MIRRLRIAIAYLLLPEDLTIGLTTPRMTIDFKTPTMTKTERLDVIKRWSGAHR